MKARKKIRKLMRNRRIKELRRIIRYTLKNTLLANYKYKIKIKFEITIKII